MKTYAEKEQALLIKKFYALLGECNKAGIKVYKDEILEVNGVSSTKDLSNHQLNIICATLYGMAYPDALSKDRLRKRVMASVGAYLKVMQYKTNSNIIIAVACRAAKVKSFNDISETNLRALYSAFIAYKKAMVSVSEITSEILTEQSR